MFDTDLLREMIDEKYVMKTNECGMTVLYNLEA